MVGNEMSYRNQGCHATNLQVSGDICMEVCLSEDVLSGGSCRPVEQSD